MPKNNDRSLEQTAEEESRLHGFQEELGNLLRRHKNQDGKTDLTMTFKGGGVIHARDFSVFLDLFTVAYNLSIVAFDYAKESAGAVAITEGLIHNALIEVSGLDEKGGFVDLEIERISYQGGMTITFTGLTAALTLAVILAGAEAETEPRGISAQLGTLDEGIRSLKKAFDDQ